MIPNSKNILVEEDFKFALEYVPNQSGLPSGQTHFLRNNKEINIICSMQSGGEQSQAEALPQSIPWGAR